MPAFPASVSDRLAHIPPPPSLARCHRDFRLAGHLIAAALLSVTAFETNAASNVVISQIYGGGGNSGSQYRNDFIELFNRSTAPVSLNGWSVQYASSTGSSWAVTPLPALTLQPGQYLLVQEAAGTGGTTSLPSPEATGTLALSATAGKVVLSSGTSAVSSVTAASVLDAVGFGNGTSGFEGAAPSVAPSNTMAILRANNGCTDTDNSRADFAASAPAPRNGSTGFNLCGAGNAPIVAQCPDRFAAPAGTGGSTIVSASDADGIVDRASIDVGATPGISLSSVGAVPVGDSTSFTLGIAATVPAGSYPLTLRFTNNQGQASQCAVTVDVQAASAATHSIPQIQGGGGSSPYVTTMQRTGGVVTLLVSNGFYLQDPAGDGNPATSDGIFVFTSSAPTVSVGDRISLSATVAEFSAGDSSRTVTQLTAVSGLTVISRGNTVTPTDMMLPLASAADFERYEGMLVRFTSPLTVSQNYFQGRYGQVTLSAGRLEKPTNRYAPRSAQAAAATAANLANMIVLDDGKSLQNPNPVPYIGADNTLRTGDSVSNLVGVIDFGLVTSSNPGPTGYKLQPAVTPFFTRDNPRTTTPTLPVGNVKVASFNVLNFFTTFTDGTTVSAQSGQGCSLGSSTSKSNCRGADTLAEFQRQRAKIVAAITAIDADALGLMEIQNNGDTAVANLVDALNAVAGGGAYAVVPKPATTGDDAIRVAMIYKPSKLTLVGPALSDPDPVNNRPPMAQTFASRDGQIFSLVVNHLKSKGSCPAAGDPDADAGDGQGCWNATRIRQAQRLASVFIPRVQAAAGDADVLVIGDMNAYGMEDPIAALGNAGLVNQIERFLRRGGVPYSYVFDGESGYLDHALATASLNSQVLGVHEWHINADEPSVIDYNTEFKPQDLYSALPYRASDHDPVVVSLNLQGAAANVTSQTAVVSSGSTANRSTGTYNTTVTLKNTGNATIGGPLHLLVSGLSSGVTVANATAYRNGVPYVTVTMSAVAPGQSVAVPVTFNNPSRVALHYVPQVYSGSFQF